MAKWKVVHRNTSIPVHLYTGVLKYTSLTVYQSHQQASVYQSTCIPVIKKSVYQSTCIPVTKSLRKYQYTSCQYTSRCRHHATTVDVSALRVVAPSSRCLCIVAPSSRCLWVVAPSSRYHRGPHLPQLPWCETGPQGPLLYRLVKIPGL